MSFSRLERIFKQIVRNRYVKQSPLFSYREKEQRVSCVSEPASAHPFCTRKEDKTRYHEQASL